MLSRLCSVQKPFSVSCRILSSGMIYGGLSRNVCFEKGFSIRGGLRMFVTKGILGSSQGKNNQIIKKPNVFNGVIADPPKDISAEHRQGQKGIEIPNSFSQQSGTNRTAEVFDLGKAKFVNRVLKTTCGGIGLSFVVSVGSIMIFQGNFMAPFLIGICGSFGSIFMISATSGRQFVKDADGHLYCQDSPIRKYGFLGLCTSMGMMISPSILMFGLADPVVLPIAAGLSFGIMGSVSYLAMRSKTLNMLKYGPPLFGGLFGLIGLGFVGMGSHLLGFHHVAEVLHQVDLYAGVGIFTALIGYDVHLAISKYDSGEPDHLDVSANLFLDFINLFIRLMEILSKLRKN